MNGDSLRASICPRCGAAFGCGVEGPGPCACFGPALSPTLRKQLSESYVGCLCVPCLQALKAADAEASRATDALKATAP